MQQLTIEPVFIAKLDPQYRWLVKCPREVFFTNETAAQDFAQTRKWGGARYTVEKVDVLSDGAGRTYRLERVSLNN